MSYAGCENALLQAADALNIALDYLDRAGAVTREDVDVAHRLTIIPAVHDMHAIVHASRRRMLSLRGDVLGMARHKADT